MAWKPQASNKQKSILSFFKRTNSGLSNLDDDSWGLENGDVARDQASRASACPTTNNITKSLNGVLSSATSIKETSIGTRPVKLLQSNSMGSQPVGRGRGRGKAASKYIFTGKSTSSDVSTNRNSAAVIKTQPVGQSTSKSVTERTFTTTGNYQLAPVFRPNVKLISKPHHVKREYSTVKLSFGFVSVEAVIKKARLGPSSDEDSDIETAPFTMNGPLQPMQALLKSLNQQPTSNQRDNIVSCVTLSSDSDEELLSNVQSLSVNTNGGGLKLESCTASKVSSFSLIHNLEQCQNEIETFAPTSVRKIKPEAKKLPQTNYDADEDDLWQDDGLDEVCANIQAPLPDANRASVDLAGIDWDEDIEFE